MKKNVFSLRWTIVTLAVGIAFWISHFIFDIEVFEDLVLAMQRLESYELDELFLVVSIMFVGIFMDLYSNSVISRQAKKLAQQKLHMINASIETLDDMLGNNISNLNSLLSQFKAQNNGKRNACNKILELAQDSICCIKQLKILIDFRV